MKFDLRKKPEEPLAVAAVIAADLKNEWIVPANCVGQIGRGEGTRSTRYLSSPFADDATPRPPNCIKNFFQL